MENEQAPPDRKVVPELDLNTAAASLSEQDSLISTFCEITSASQSESIFFLESHNYNLDDAVSTFLETATPTAVVDVDVNNSNRKPSHSDFYSPSQSQSKSSSSSPSRSRSPSPPSSRLKYNLRSSSLKSSRASTSRQRTSGIRTLKDLSNDASGSDSDEHHEYYTGGEKSGMLVQDPSMVNDVDAIFNQARQSRGVEIPADHLLPSSSSRSFTGTARLLTGETLPSAPQQPGVVTHEVVFWTNGVRVDGGPLRRLEDPENASFLELLCVRNNGKIWKCGKPVIPGSRPQYCSRHLAGYKGRQNERRMAFQQALIEDMESQLILWERKLNEQDFLVVELKDLLAHKKMKILEAEQIRKELHNTIMACYPPAGRTCYHPTSRACYHPAGQACYHPAGRACYLSTGLAFTHQKWKTSTGNMQSNMMIMATLMFLI